MPDIEKILLGFIAGLLTMILGRMMSKKDKIEEKKENKCEIHTERLVEIEKENIRQDGQIESIQKLLIEVRQDVKTLLARL